MGPLSVQYLLTYRLSIAPSRKKKGTLNGDVSWTGQSGRARAHFLVRIPHEVVVIKEDEQVSRFGSKATDESMTADHALACKPQHRGHSVCLSCEPLMSRDA
jgi:hypothetical protein